MLYLWAFVLPTYSTKLRKSRLKWAIKVPPGKMCLGRRKGEGGEERGRREMKRGGRRRKKKERKGGRRRKKKIKSLFDTGEDVEMIKVRRRVRDEPPHSSDLNVSAVRRVRLLIIQIQTPPSLNIRR